MDLGSIANKWIVKLLQMKLDQRYLRGYTVGRNPKNGFN